MSSVFCYGHSQNPYILAILTESGDMCKYGFEIFCGILWGWLFDILIAICVIFLEPLCCGLKKKISLALGKLDIFK